MKRRIIFVFAVILVLIGLFIILRIVTRTITPKGQGALQVTTNLKAQVFLNGQTLGATPLCKCDQGDTIDSGEYELRIVPEDTSLQTFTAQVNIEPGVLTAVERTFLPGSLSSAYILTLEKIDSTNAQLFVGSLPEGALVTIDSVATGVTPLSLQSITASEHEVEVHKQGFSKKTIKIRTVPEFKLVINVILGTEGKLQQATPTPTPTTTPSGAPKEDSSTKIRIIATPNGFLRVRQGPSTGTSEIGRVTPGQTFDLLDEEGEWYKIKLPEGEEGWISAQFAEKLSNSN